MLYRNRVQDQDSRANGNTRQPAPHRDPLSSSSASVPAFKRQRLRSAERLKQLADELEKVGCALDGLPVRGDKVALFKRNALEG